MKEIVILVIAVLAGTSLSAPANSDRIVFVENDKKRDKDPIITPPVLPVIEHLERDPTTLNKEDNEVLPKNGKDSTGASPRFGFTGGFGAAPTGDGGFSASFSHGFSGLAGQSQSGSHSFTVGAPSKGIQVSQTSSQASSFGANQGFLGSSISGSQASSQSSSFSTGFQGISSSSSAASAASSAGSLFGQGFSASNAQSQSAANHVGLQGISSAFGQGSGFSGSFPGSQSFSNGQSSSGAFGNGAVAQGSGLGFGQNSNGFSGSGANSQSVAAIIGETGPSGGFYQPIDIRGQRNFGVPISFPGPTNIKQRNPFHRTISRDLIVPSQVRKQEFRQPRRKPSTYQIIRIEV